MRPGNLAPHGDPSDQLPVSALAEQVLRSLSARGAPAEGPVCPHRVALLMDAVLAPAAFEAAQVIERMLASGLTQRAVADEYVPQVARRLGDCWSSDELSFTKVTIASGRLQEMLGHLAQANDLPAAADRATPRVVLLALSGDQHTLGWKLVALQLRRQGITVQAVPGATVAEAADLIEASRCELVLVSASRLSVLDNLSRIAEALRARMTDVPPIVLGGLVCDRLGPGTRLPDVACITNDLSVALSCKTTRYRGLRSELE